MEESHSREQVWKNPLNGMNTTTGNDHLDGELQFLESGGMKMVGWSTEGAKRKPENKRDKRGE